MALVAITSATKQAAHHRSRRFLALSDQKKLSLPQGTKLALTPTIALPFLRCQDWNHSCLPGYWCSNAGQMEARVSYGPPAHPWQTVGHGPLEPLVFASVSNQSKISNIKLRLKQTRR